MSLQFCIFFLHLLIILQHAAAATSMLNFRSWADSAHNLTML